MNEISRQANLTPQTCGQNSDVVIDGLGLLLRAAPNDLDAAIQAVLERLAIATEADRAYVCLRSADGWRLTHEWCAGGVTSQQQTRASPLADDFGAWRDTLEVGAALSVASVKEMQNGTLRELLISQHVQSFAEVKLTGDASVQGVLGVARTRTEQEFEDRDIRLLRALSDGVSASLARRQAEEKLRAIGAQQAETLERLRATLASMPELLLEIDDEGRCTDYHCAAPELLVAPPDSTIGRTLEDVLPAPIARLQRAAMAEAQRHGTAHVGPYALGHGADKRWFSLTVSKHAKIAGRQGFLFRARDITKEKARDAENAMLFQVTRQMTSMATVLDQDLHVKWVNPAVEAREGRSLDAMRGRPPPGYCKHASDPHEISRIQHALATRTACHAEAAKIDHAGGTYYVDVDVQPFVDADGSFHGAMVIETDITQRKASEAQFRQVAREASESRQRLHDAITAIPDAFAVFDAEDRLVLHNSKYLESLPMTKMDIHLGMRFEDILRLGVKRGEFPDAIGHEEAWLAERIAFHQDAKGELELRMRNGRWMRAYERVTPDGGRVGLRIDITALKTTQQHMTDIIDGAGIGTWEYDVATNVTTLNHHWALILGTEPKSLMELNKENSPLVFHPDDAVRARNALEAVISGESEWMEQEVRLRHRDGHWIHALVRGRASVTDQNGRPARISGIGLDLTQRRQTEERLHAILNASSIGTWQLNSVTGVAVIDDQYAAMLGYTLDDLLPWTHQKFENLVHPEDLSEMLARTAQLHGFEQTDIAHEFRMRHRDGHWVWILSQARILSWSGTGRPGEESGVHIDITERKSREAALNEAKNALDAASAAQRDLNQRFADIALASDDWFWEINCDNKIAYLSSGFERITGLSAESMQGRTLAEFGVALGSDRTQFDWDRFAECVALREKLSNFLFKFTRDQTHAPIWLRITGAPYFDQDNVYAGYRGVGSDVSALIAATEHAEAANHAKTRFLANMSHELRTPLTGVLGMADLLADTEVSGTQREMIETIRESGEGLLVIVNDILDLAKIEAGKLTLDHQVFAPADMFRRVAALYGPRADAAGLTLELELEPRCRVPRIGDTNRIQQILHNLVGNAIKFTLHGRIRIAGRILPDASGEYLEITVSDTGIGMSQDQIAKVFDEFEQAEGSTARRFGGTGLGLSITRRLVALMAGTINLASELGAGTQIIVSLPMNTVPPPSQKSALVQLPATDLSGMRVLVADDNQTNQKILATLLGKLGADVTLAKDGHEACQLYEPGAFDMLLLDISMPGLDGIGALDAIRLVETHAKVAPVPALAVTANAMQHQIEAYLSAGFADHVAKPFRKGALAETIVRHRLGRV